MNDKEPVKPYIAIDAIREFRSAVIWSVDHGGKTSRLNVQRKARAIFRCMTGRTPTTLELERALL